MRTIEAAIFDLDGVIVNTAKYHFLAWKKLAAELGFEFTAKDNERLKGVSRMRSLEIVLEIGGINASDAQKLKWAEQKNEWYLEYIRAISPSEILPGVVSFINELRVKGVKIALASASKNAVMILENLAIQPLFDAIVDGNQVSKIKPDPEVFLKAAGKLKTIPSNCVVFEDAIAGVEAGKKAGMKVIGIGDPATLSQADQVIPNFVGFDYECLTSPKNKSSFLLRDTEYSQNNIELNGSRFLLGNGYMGYRGTLEEFTKEELVACTLAGIYDRAGDAWREPVNAPNGFHTMIFCDDRPLTPTMINPEEHEQLLDLKQAVHHRATLFNLGHNKVKIMAERFLSLDNVHLMVMKYQFQCAKDSEIIIQTGIDGEIWDINGPHLKEFKVEAGEGQLSSISSTNEGELVVVAELLDSGFDHQEIIKTDKSIYREITMQAEAGKEYCFYKYVSVYTSKDSVKDLKKAAIANNILAKNTGYNELRCKHSFLWNERWQRSDVVIEGDPEGLFALRYSIYQLLIAAPIHTDKLSIPARSLSGQTYKGAIFWDTEMFMLPFFIYTQPQLAKNIMQYRYATLDGARRKAAEYGYRGAFYAWESQETGDDACTLFNVTDVFSGRPMRTYFRDKQIHISADVVYGIWQYFTITGDEGILLEGGAEIILECARFFVSYAYFKKDKNRYEILEVTGPDEYHERVSNNAYTNYMVKYSLGIALQIINLLKHNDNKFYQNLIAKLDFEKEIAAIQEMHRLLYLPAPALDTLVIEQFDGYGKLEDVSLDELKQRVKIPNEYWGGGNGLAITTCILKQADVVLLLNLFKKDFSHEIKKANWEYYEPRTEHGSSLSSCVYAMLATDIGKPDWAYPYFQKTATIDLTGDYKRYVGTLYIGGTHPAANGGAWMATIFGFCGLHFDGKIVNIKPKLPTKWESVSFNIIVNNQTFMIYISVGQVKVKAAVENTQIIHFNIAGNNTACEPGKEVVINLTDKGKTKYSQVG